MSTDTTDTADDAAQTEDAQVTDTTDTADETAGDTTDESQDTTEEETGGETEEEGDQAADPQQLMKWARDNLGESDLTGKYTDDASYLRARHELERRLSQRDDDAVLGRQLRESGRQAELFGPKQPETKAEAPPTWDQFQLLRAQVQNQDGSIREDAPPELVIKVNAIAKKMQKAAYEMAVQPDKVLEPHLKQVSQSLIEANAQTLQQQSAEQQVHTEMQQLGRDNAWMFADGKPPGPNQQIALSPEGQQLNAKFEENERRYAPRYDEAGNLIQAGFNKAQILNLTLDMHARDQAGQRNPTRTPNKRARHTPNTATTIPPQKPPEDEEFEDEMERLNNERIARETAAL